MYQGKKWPQGDSPSNLYEARNLTEFVIHSRPVSAVRSVEPIIALTATFTTVSSRCPNLLP
jgi:hypothetical protein